VRRLVLYLIAAFVLGLSLPVTADTLQGRVVGIADGDTVTVLDAGQAQHKIRLMGIDAPEKKQAFGQRSKQHLSDLVFQKQVVVEYSKKDRYGRTLGKILIDGVDAQPCAGEGWDGLALQAISKRAVAFRLHAVF